MLITIIPRRFLQLLLPACFLLLVNSASAQDSYQRLTVTIDSLAKLNLPKSALVATDKLDKLARSQKNTAQHIKAVLYRMRFQSFVTENAIVGIVNDLKQDIQQAIYPEKPVLQSLLGNIYWMYYQQNRYVMLQRSRVGKPGTDFTQWDLQTLNNAIDQQYKLSLQDIKQEQQTPITVLDGVLEGDKRTRNLRPTLYDFLVQRALDYYLTDEAGLNQPKTPFGLYDPRFFGDSRAFALLDIATTDTASTLYKGIKYLQQATMFHLQRQDDEATADLDLKRLELMYNHAAVNNKDQLYMDALAQIAGTLPDKAVSADAMALQGKYYYTKDSLKQALVYFNRAAAAFAGSTGALNAAGYLRTIQQQELNLSVEDVNVPDKPLLGLVSYRNVKNVRLQLYKISATTFNRLAAIRYLNMGSGGITIYPSDSVLTYFKTQRPVQTQLFSLPGVQDYKKHSAEFKMDPLSTGVYVAILQDTTSVDPALLQINTFKITHLGFVIRRQPDSAITIRVADRETGKPMPGVHVIMAEHDEGKITDNNGVCNLGIAPNTYSIKVTTKNDTLYTPTRYSYGQALSNNQKVNRRTVIFTDREIYRPGQMVYFKGIALQSADGKTSLVTGDNVTVTVKANNQQPVISIPLVTNEYGTFSGSFTIPQNILNGGVTIATANDGYKYIRVEEYKRPGFQVVFQPITGNYKPNDSITVQGNVAAYSGYGISKTKVIYHVTRMVSLTDYRLYNQYRNLVTRSTDILTDTIVTDNKGQFTVKFKALPGQNDHLGNFRFTFNVNATVSDGTGETRTAYITVSTGINNIRIVSSIPYRGYVRDTLKALVKITNLNGVAQSGSIKLNIYALKEPGILFKTKQWGRPDKYLLDSLSYKKNFPAELYHDEDAVAKWPVKNQVTELISTTTGDQQFSMIDLSVMKNQPSGTYKIVVHGTNAQGDTTSVINYLHWQNEPALPGNINEWVISSSSKQIQGQPLEYYVGTGVKGQVLVEKYSGPVLLSTQMVNVPGGKQQLVKIPVLAGEKNVSVQFLMISQNRVYTSYQRIAQSADDRLNIKFITFRNQLQPGQKEQWKLQVTGKNQQTPPVEMMAGMYDASLDAIININNWNYNLEKAFYTPDYFVWDNFGFVAGRTSYPYNYNSFYFNGTVKQYEHLNLFGYNYYGGYNMGYHATVTKAREIQIRGNSTYLKGSADAAVRIDEPVGNSDLNEVFTAVSSDRVVMRELTTPPGQKFSQEAIIRSAKEISALGNFDEDKIGYGNQPTVAGRGNPIIPRKNFNETAFFYPQLHTDEQGQVLIDFTIPEALTRWRFKAFAHTKDLQSGFIEQEIVTQKQLSISANMPRFLRAGDTITISARLANLTSAPIKGNVQLQLFNALNMQPVNLLVHQGDAAQSFDLAATSTKPVSFRMVIPAGLDALTYRLTAGNNQFSDGEENTLPVLPNQILVTETMPMMVRPGETKTFTMDKLLNQHSNTLKSKTLTLEYTQNPAWYAVQALPYMMDDANDCSEQLFNRYYANSMATNLVNRLPVIQKIFEQWKGGSESELLSNLEKNQELKSALIEEAPWLQDAQNETEQKKRIALLFDLNKMSYELQSNIEKLKQKQLPDGGFPWFGGDKADGYITRYILAGIGQLYHLNITDTKNVALKTIADKAMAYVETQLLDEAKALKQQNKYESRIPGITEIYSYYVRSYFPGIVPDDEMTSLTNNYLQLIARDWRQKSIYEQGLIALTLLRNHQTEAAQIIIRSLNETAQHSSDMGMYWPKNQAGYYWYQAPIETQSLMIELFTEAGGNDKAVAEMKLWLLRNKQINNWKTTKATAAACYALLLKSGDNWITDTGTADIKLGGTLLTESKPGLKTDAGTGYIKTNWTDTQIKPSLGKVEVKNNATSISWGALYWQYLENLDKITPSQTDIHLDRKYFIRQQRSDQGNVWIAVDATHQPHTGDLLKVIVYLKAGRDFEYVQLKDMRPAGTEPVDILSAYKYQGGLYYYQVTKDVATNFFISQLNKGNYVFEYNLRVAQPGNFSTGISTVQSMYAPEFNAHSEGVRLLIKP